MRVTTAIGIAVIERSTAMAFKWAETLNRLSSEREL